MPDHVVIVCPVHSSDDIRVYQKQALSLVGAGYRVTMIAGQVGAEVDSRISLYIHNLPHSRLIRILRIPGLIWRVVRTHGDVYLLHNPDCLVVGYILKILGRKVVYDTHEDFSKRILTRQWIPYGIRHIMAKIIIWLEHGASLYFNAVFVTQPQVVKRLDGRATLLRNAPLTCGAVIERARVLSSDIDKGKFARLIYAGVIDESRGLSNMVEALPAINGLMAARLWLMGRICDHDLGTAESLEGWRYVDYVGMVPQSVAYAYMAKADVGLILLDDVADYSQTSPNKLYEYMFWKVPFVATGFESWRRQLGEVKAGIFIEKAQESACTEAVLTLLSSPSTAEAMGENGHRYICSEFSWEKEADVFLQKIDEVLDSNQIG